MSTRSMAGSRARLSIGALSRATGIPVETLRTWEHRYGFPVPERKPSGHRVYPTSTAVRLRRIADALARGHRANEAVTASDAELDALLDATPGSPLTAGRAAPLRSSSQPDGGIDALLDAVALFDTEHLQQILRAAYTRLGPLEFLEQRVGPLVEAVGERWHNGTLQVRHEHFLSEIVGDMLRVLRGPFAERAEGPLIVFATLPGELHGLGLQMAALVAAVAGSRVVYLGTETPVDEMVTVATDLGARAVAVSVSTSTRGAGNRRALAAIRRRLPQRVHLIVGGQGAPHPSEGVSVVSSLGELDALVHRLRVG